MARRTTGLADRLRAAVERERAGRSAEDVEKQRVADEARAAREALFGDLERFGRDTGFLDVVRRPEGVQFGWNGRFVRFESRGETGVGLDFSGAAQGESNRLYQEGALGNRWVWVRERGRRENRLVLFDQGLEVLLVHALGLPEPDDGDEVEPSAPAAKDDGDGRADGDTRKRRL